MMFLFLPQGRLHPAAQPFTRRARGRERPPSRQRSGEERVLARKPPKTGVVPAHAATPQSAQFSRSFPRNCLICNRSLTPSPENGAENRAEYVCETLFTPLSRPRITGLLGTERLSLPKTAVANAFFMSFPPGPETVPSADSRPALAPRMMIKADGNGAGSLLFPNFNRPRM